MIDADAPLGPQVWVDGFPLSNPLGSGIATYTRGLVRALAGLGADTAVLLGRALGEPRDPVEMEVRLFDAAYKPRGEVARVWRTLRELRGPLALPVPESGMVDRGVSPSVATRYFSTASVPPKVALWNADDMFARGWTHLRLTRKLMAVRTRHTGPAVMHWAQVQAVRMPGALNVYTIHDLIPLRLPWATGDKKKLWLRATRAIAQSADHIIAVSEHGRREVIAYLGVPPERVTNTYQSVTLDPPALDERQAADRLLGVYGVAPREFFLFVSSIEPRKNIPRLLDAYYASGTQRPLFLVGRDALQADEQLRVLTRRDEDSGERRSPDGRIRHLGYLPRFDVEMLLRHARALLFPSLYEGFGLPAAEAMLAGTAVLTSSTTSLPEVVGDAAVVVEPTDVRALADGIRALDCDDALRAQLELAGPERAAMFTPERHAARLAALHAQLGAALPGDRH